ncbi:MAG TPA: aldolase/citrate lyase family protein [Catenuloplanes sp.]|jgi:citrate lyase beta subunit
MRLGDDVYAELDRRLASVDAQLRARYPGEPAGRQPVHTVYVPADRFTADLVASWGAAALDALAAHPPLPFPTALADRVRAKLAREPIEDLRIDLEDGYGVRDDAQEDAAVRAAAVALRHGGRPPFTGLRIKSLEHATRHRAVRTVDIFLDAFGGLPDGFVLTLPKVSHPAQVAAMVLLCERCEATYGLPAGSLRFEVQVETPPAVLGPDGTATVAGLITAAQGRCVGLHYGTYDYSAACGIAAAYQSMEHPAADHAKAVMQVAAAGTGVRLSDGSTNVLPVGSTEQVHAAWAVHLRLVRRSLERGFYQGWDLHPAQLPTRFAATYGFFRDGCPPAATRLRGYLDRRSGGHLDEPATARALAGFLRRGLDCGALDPEEAGFSGPELAALC